jgi:hypothetical protein
LAVGVLTLLPLSGNALKPPNPDVPIGGIPMGTGASIHSPNSPFAPLTERADVLPWSMLTTTKTKVKKQGPSCFNARLFYRVTEAVEIR